MCPSRSAQLEIPIATNTWVVYRDRFPLADPEPIGYVTATRRQDAKRSAELYFGKPVVVQRQSDLVGRTEHPKKGKP